MFITNWGDETAIYQVNYQAASKLASFDRITGLHSESGPRGGQPASTRRISGSVRPYSR